MKVIQGAAWTAAIAVFFAMALPSITWLHAITFFLWMVGLLLLAHFWQQTKDYRGSLVTLLVVSFILWVAFAPTRKELMQDSATAFRGFFGDVKEAASTATEPLPKKEAKFDFAPGERVATGIMLDAGDWYEVEPTSAETPISLPNYQKPVTRAIKRLATGRGQIVFIGGQKEGSAIVRVL